MFAPSTRDRSLRRLVSALAICLVALFAASLARAETVTTIAPSTNTDPGVWYESTVTGTGGSVSIVDLTGAGGDLENNQPLPTGSVLLATSTDNNDRANIGIFDDFGLTQDIFATLSLSYSYHKASNAGQNLFAAPALKLAFYNATCDDPASAGDCYGQLIYEPTWNQPGFEGSSVAPPLDAWQNITVDANNGLFWWTGGFGQPNTAGGPPLRTLAEWAAVFSTDFGDADLAQIEIGVGSYNQLQLGYVDDVRISHASGAGYDRSFDFEAPALPFLGGAGVLGLGALLVIGLGAATALRRRS